MTHSEWVIGSWRSLLTCLHLVTPNSNVTQLSSWEKCFASVRSTPPSKHPEHKQAWSVVTNQQQKGLTKRLWQSDIKPEPKLPGVKISDKISPPVICVQEVLLEARGFLYPTIRDHLSIVIIRDEDKNNADTIILLTLPGKYRFIYFVSIALIHSGYIHICCKCRCLFLTMTTGSILWF